MVRSVLDARTMRRLALFVGLSLWIAGALLACGVPRLPAPIYVGHPTDALQQVEYPPPPARVEFIPAAPQDDAVWIDGEWTWQGRRWAWKRGRWVVPPPNGRFSPWTATRDKSGLLYVAEGRWRDAEGRELPEPKPIAVAQTRGGRVTDPQGTPIPPTPNVTPGTPSGTWNTKGDGAAGGPETPSGATPTGTEPRTAPSEPDAAAPSDAGLVDVP
jgi:hypothetical protein